MDDFCGSVADVLLAYPSLILTVQLHGHLMGIWTASRLVEPDAVQPTAGHEDCQCGNTRSSYPASQESLGAEVESELAREDPSLPGLYLQASNACAQFNDRKSTAKGMLPVRRTSYGRACNPPLARPKMGGWGCPFETLARPHTFQSSTSVLLSMTLCD